jgi:ribonuclease HIII
MKNLNKLLAEGHARAIAAVLTKHQADLAISDKFGKTQLIEDALRETRVNVKLRQVVRGEEFLPVAAASILARACFIREIEKLTARFNIEIPRGAASIVDDAGRRLLQKYPSLDFGTIAKTHFKNYRRIMNPTLFSA